MIGQWLQQLFRRSHRPAVPAGVTTPQPPPPTDSDIHTAAPVDDPLALFLPFQIRPLESTDLGELLGVVRQAIQISAADQYDQQQRDAWSRAQSHESLISALSEGEAVVAEWEDALVGFAHRVGGYINMVFVHPRMPAAWASPRCSTSTWKTAREWKVSLNSQPTPASPPTIFSTSWGSPVKGRKTPNATAYACPDTTCANLWSKSRTATRATARRSTPDD